MDIDNFRLLNENYGHTAGDRALVTVVDLFGRDLPANVILGRYDELLLVAPKSGRRTRGASRGRTALADHALQFDTSSASWDVSRCLHVPDHGEW